jgi:hypothetical protein
LASGGVDGTIRLWDVATRRPLAKLLIDTCCTVWSVAFSPDGKTLASTSSAGTPPPVAPGMIQLWDVATRRPLGRPITDETSAVVTAAFSPSGKTLAWGSADGTIRFLDVATHRQLGAPLTGHTDAVWDVAFSPDGTMLASASDDSTIRLWDVATHRQIGPSLIGNTSPPGTDDGVLSVAFSPDGKTLASGGDDGTIRLWALNG